MRRHDTIGRMTGPVLTETVQVRLRAYEKRALQRVAAHHERTPSEMLRRLIRKEARRVARQQARKANEHGSEEGSEER
jgi:predicted transcriptional regulator